MNVRTIAPAKVNWTLEVLGERRDGYHEIRSVMQTIDICDEVWLGRGEGLTLDVSGAIVAADDDHALRAARLLARVAGRELPATIHIEKRIPLAAGLGGGSSDAAATLRGLNQMSELGLPHGELKRLAAEIGSDVPFFLTGGTALAEGRGERVTPLPDAPEAWLVIVAPPIVMQEKTKSMYGALRAGDFTDGTRTAALADRLRRGERVPEEDMCNAFERAAYESFEGLVEYRDRIVAAGAEGVHLAGAGPALITSHGSREDAEAVAGRLDAGQARVFVARTLGAAEATRVVVSR